MCTQTWSGTPFTADLAISPNRCTARPCSSRWTAGPRPPRSASLLAANDVVLLDRYVTSNAAYGSARLGGPAVDTGFADWVRDLEIDRFGIPVPDRQVLLATPLAVAAERARGRAATADDRALDTFEADAGLQHRTGEMYRLLAAADYLSPWTVLTPDLGGRLTYSADLLVDGADRESADSCCPGRSAAAAHRSASARCSLADPHIDVQQSDDGAGPGAGQPADQNRDELGDDQDRDRTRGPTMAPTRDETIAPVTVPMIMLRATVPRIRPRWPLVSSTLRRSAETPSPVPSQRRARRKPRADRRKRQEPPAASAPSRPRRPRSRPRRAAAASGRAAVRDRATAVPAQSPPAPA